MARKKPTNKKRATENNISEIPNQSGVYLLYKGQGDSYVGSAGASNLQKRIRQQLIVKRGITSFKYRTTSSEVEARRLEKKYRDRYNPNQKNIEKRHQFFAILKGDKVSSAFKEVLT